MYLLSRKNKIGKALRRSHFINAFILLTFYKARNSYISNISFLSKYMHKFSKNYYLHIKDIDDILFNYQNE